MNFVGGYCNEICSCRHAVEALKVTVIGVGGELQTYNGVNAAALLREVLAKLGAIIAVGGTCIVKATQEQLEFYQGGK